MRKSTGYEMRDTRYENGSALILAVVLTSLLAIVGVLFVMAARVDKIATSAISENKDLDFAVDTVITKISQELTLDVPHNDPCRPFEEYYDYPDSRNPWLASLEPNDSMMWPQISNVTGAEVVWVDWPAEIVPDYQHDVNEGLIADADGDGVSDSVWIELDDMTSSKGKPIFAAIRIIDNGAMLNVNTAYKFDPYDPNVQAADIDGSSQMQINLMALAGRPPLPSWPVGNPYTPADETDLLRARANYGVGVNPFDLQAYKENVIWRYGTPSALYTSFDISDELELRYRFLLNHEDIDTRLEGWGGEFRDTVFSTPVTSGGQELTKWFKRVHFDPSILDMNDLKDPNYYAYRHVATTYNMDRIIRPDGNKMLNLNTLDLVDANSVISIRNMIRTALGATPDLVKDAMAAQITANLIDYVDADSHVSVVLDSLDPNNLYYGFEQPCVYISELVYAYEIDADDPNIIHRSYAVELYKPYIEDTNDLTGWQLAIDANVYDVKWLNKTGTRQFYVKSWEDPVLKLVVDFNDPNVKADTIAILTDNIIFDNGSIIELRRPLAAGGYVVVDSVSIPGWLVADSNGIRSYQRDITPHKCIRRLWDIAGTEPNSTLGTINTYKNGDSIYIQAHPANSRFTNIGEIGMVLRRNTYTPQLGVYPPDIIGYKGEIEADVRLNLADLNFQQLFNYLTVFDPTVDGIDNDGDGYGLGANLDLNELKIPGRININTAPWFVIAQLPWVSPQLAQAIVAYRDKLKLWDGVVVDYSDDRDRGRTRGRARGMWELVDQPPPPILVRETLGFANVGELINVTHDLAGGGVFYDQWYDIRRYGRDTEDQGGFPDLTTNPPRTGIDGAPDDFEERDLIFARISNLVTVRSDVFTAYILVRIGADGPQKRVIAILDRSDVYPDGKGGVIGKVKVRAVQPVPDPR